jgi:hypothetical protein
VQNLPPQQGREWRCVPPNRVHQSPAPHKRFELHLTEIALENQSKKQRLEEGPK